MSHLKKKKVIGKTCLFFIFQTLFFMWVFFIGSYATVVTLSRKKIKKNKNHLLFIKLTMANQNVMMDQLMDSIKATLTDANMMGFESYTEQTLAFFYAVHFFYFIFFSCQIDIENSLFLS